jgi:HlyD family secretion protein
VKRFLRICVTLVILAGLAGAGVWLWRARQVQAKSDIATATARRGDFQVIVRSRGELYSNRSVQLVAPYNVPGLQISWQAPANSEVKKDDVVLRFDSSLARQQLAEKQAALQQAQATLDQAIAQARMTGEQDRVDITSARVEVEKQVLEVSKQEIVSKLQGEASRVDLGLAEEKQRVTQASAELHKKSDESKLASFTRQRDKAQQDIDVTNRRLGQMEIKAPLGGIIVYFPNQSQGWVNAKPFKVGDQVWPGSVIAEIPELSSLEIKGKIEEIDRGRIAVGQEVRITVDPFPEKRFTGKLHTISPLVEQTFEWPPVRNFRANAIFNEHDDRLRPGMNGRIDIVVEHIPDAISVPANAVFTRHGRPTVYLPDKQGWRPQEVEIVARNPDEVAVRGIEAGAKIALIDPSLQNSGQSAAKESPGEAPKQDSGATK